MVRSKWLSASHWAARRAKQVADLEEAGILRELIDGITPMEQDASIAIDIGIPARRRRWKRARVKGEVPFPRKAGYVDDFWPFRARPNGQFDQDPWPSMDRGFLRHGWLWFANRGAKGNASDAPCACQRDFCPGQNRARSPVLWGKLAQLVCV